MNVTVEHLAPCRKLVRVEVDTDAVEKMFEETTVEVVRKAELPGFRAGRAPRHLVVKTYTPHIEKEARRKLLGATLEKAVKEQNLRVFGTPEVEEIQFGRGQSYQFAATVETFPEYELPEYKGIPIKVENTAVTDADLEKAMGILREQRADFKDVTHPVQNGDIIVVNYSATSEGKPLTDFSPASRGITAKKDTWMEVKPGFFVDGFTEQLLGAQAGEKRTVNVVFPKDFVAPALSERQAVYEVEVLKVKEKILPEFNDAFAKLFGAESLEKLREGVRADLARELQMKKDSSSRSQALSTLLGRVSFDMPESLIAAETRNAVYQMVSENQKKGVPKELIDQKKDEIFQYASSSAKERLKSTFLLTRIAQKENIKVSEEEFGRRILHLAQQNNMKPDQLVKELQAHNGLNKIHEDILVAKALEFLVSNGQIEEVAPGAAPQPEA